MAARQTPRRQDLERVHRAVPDDQNPPRHRYDFDTHPAAYEPIRVRIDTLFRIPARCLRAPRCSRWLLKSTPTRDFRYQIPPFQLRTTDGEQDLEGGVGEVAACGGVDPLGVEGRHALVRSKSADTGSIGGLLAAPLRERPAAGPAPSRLTASAPPCRMPRCLSAPPSCRYS